LRLFGVALGFALAATVLFASPGWIEHMIASTGAGKMTLYARPPLGATARAALAAVGLALGVGLGFILALIFGRGRVDDAYGYDSPVPTVPSPSPSPSSLDVLGWRAPAGNEVTLPIAATTTTSEAEVAALFAASRRSPPVPPVARLMAPAASEALHEQAAVVSHDRESAPMSDQAAALARIEATLADLTRSGPSQTWERLEAMDARLAQMAQQLAEIAAFGRAQQRTPERVRAPQPPTDPAQRLAMTETARLLRARLGDAELV